MPEDTFKMISSGLFTSLVLYCIEVYGNVFGLDKLDETKRKSPAFTKKDCSRLQILQNKALKIQMKLPRDYPTKDLLIKSDNLSIHQLIGYHTLVQVFKIVHNSKPKYLAEKFKIRNQVEDQIAPQIQNNTLIVTNVTLSISRGGFIY